MIPLKLLLFLLLLSIFVTINFKYNIKLITKSQKTFSDYKIKAFKIKVRVKYLFFVD